jgi:hypothetical protein
LSAPQELRAGADPGLLRVRIPLRLLQHYMLTKGTVINPGIGLFGVF